jgi:hypothetical protein
MLSKKPPHWSKRERDGDKTPTTNFFEKKKQQVVERHPQVPFVCPL